MAESNKNQKVSVAFSDRNVEDNPDGLQICDVTDNPAFDMTAMLSAVQLYTKINFAVNQLIGMEVRWFRAVPQQRAQDVIFQEYTLSCVEDTPLCLRVVLPNGDFPDSAYNYDLMGLEYEVPLEVHIDKAYWESFAGGGSAPQKNDIVYFAVPNKLYEVVSSYLLRGFMEQETTWKINLRKYQPKASRKEGPNLTQTIDDYTVSEGEIFGEKIASDVQKLQDDKQMSPFNSTERDKYKTMDKDLFVATSRLEMYGTVIAESFYDLGSSNYFNAVTYNPSDNISSTDDRCITAWTMIDPGVVTNYEVESITYNAALVYPANYVVKTKTRINQNRITPPSAGDNIEISRPGSLNFYATIVDYDPSDNDNTFHVQIDDVVVDHLASIKTAWTTAKGYKMKVQNPVSILDGINGETSGFKVDIYANQYLKIVYGSQQHIAIITEKLLDKDWYGIVVNIGNSWGQYNTYIYKQHPSDAATKLKNIFYETMDFTPENTYVDYYAINKSPSYLTNIRLYVSTMEEEKQMNELLSYFVKDGDQLIIGDNADPKFRAPYTGQQR
jgi:hypothetical protein